METSKYDVGGRNFLFVTVPPIDRSPLVCVAFQLDVPRLTHKHVQMLAQPDSSRSLEASVISGFNTKLISRAANLSATRDGVQTFVYDANAAFAKVLDNPTAYGFVDATSYGGPGDFWG